MNDKKGIEGNYYGGELMTGKDGVCPGHVATRILFPWPPSEWRKQGTPRPRYKYRATIHSDNCWTNDIHRNDVRFSSVHYNTRLRAYPSIQILLHFISFTASVPYFKRQIMLSKGTNSSFCPQYFSLKYIMLFGQSYSHIPRTTMIMQPCPCRCMFTNNVSLDWIRVGREGKGTSGQG